MRLRVLLVALLAALLLGWGHPLLAQLLSLATGFVPFLVLVNLGLIFIYGLLFGAGSILCCWVPPKSKARTLIIISVALNGAVVPRAAWPVTSLKAGDVIEIVRAQQGG